MIGIVIVTHGELGEALIGASEFIFEARPAATLSVSIDLSQKADTLRKRIADGIQAVDDNQGVLLLTDMFGGSPSNLSYSFLEEGRIEVISGVNLPILIKAVSAREKMSLSELAEHLEITGKNSITLASSILKGNKRAKQQR